MKKTFKYNSPQIMPICTIMILFAFNTLIAAEFKRLNVLEDKKSNEIILEFNNKTYSSSTAILVAYAEYNISTKYLGNQIFVGFNSMRSASEAAKICALAMTADPIGPHYVTKIECIKPLDGTYITLDKFIEITYDEVNKIQ